MPIDACGRTQQVPVGPDGAIGEKITGIGLIPKPFRENFRPTHMVTFRHPYTGRNVTVSHDLAPGKAAPPGDSARPHHLPLRRVPDRGAFLRDAQIETFYNAGFLRQVKAAVKESY